MLSVLMRPSESSTVADGCRTFPSERELFHMVYAENLIFREYRKRGLRYAEQIKLPGEPWMSIPEAYRHMKLEDYIVEADSRWYWQRAYENNDYDGKPGSVSEWLMDAGKEV